MKALPVLVLLVSLSQSILSAAEVRTYRIIETEVPSFRYGGGLLDFNLTAHLRGTIQVAIGGDNSASVSGFDLTLHNLINSGTYDLGWVEGDALADHLNFDPFSLHGEMTQESGLDRLLLSSVEPALSSAVLANYLSIFHTSTSSATLVLTSTYLESDPSVGLPHPLLDVPSMRIGTSPGVGVLVALVPEPSSVMLAAVGLMAVGLLRRGR